MFEAYIGLSVMFFVMLGLTIGGYFLLRLKIGDQIKTMEPAEVVSQSIRFGFILAIVLFLLWLFVSGLLGLSYLLGDAILSWLS
jgi:hypothetical protein